RATAQEGRKTVMAPPPQQWDGTTCLTRSNYIALVVFTAAAASPGPAVEPVIAAAGNGQDVQVVPPARLGNFLRVPAGAHFLRHDAGELHRLLHEYLASDAVARQLLWKAVADGRLADIGLLDQLLRLAQDGASRPPRPTLRQLAQQHAHLALRDEEGLRSLIAS